MSAGTMSMRQPRHVMTMSSEGGRFRRSRRIPVPLSLSWAWCVVCGDYASREDNHGRPVLPPLFFLSRRLLNDTNIYSQSSRNAPTSIENTPWHIHDYRSPKCVRPKKSRPRSPKLAARVLFNGADGQWAMGSSPISNIQQLYETQRACYIWVNRFQSNLLPNTNTEKSGMLYI